MHFFWCVWGAGKGGGGGGPIPKLAKESISVSI